MAYPGFFRRRVLAYRKAHGLTIKETAEHFKIGYASIVRWVHKPEPTKTRNKPPVKIPEAALLKDVEEYPDAYHYERAKRLGVSASGICYALKRLGITCKKNTTASQSRPNVASGISDSAQRTPGE